jgi:predicted DNA-binding protein
MEKKSSEKVVHLGIKVPFGLKSEFTKLAIKRGKTVSAIIREFMESKVRIAKGRGVL